MTSMSIRLVKGRIDLVIKSEVEIKLIYGWWPQGLSFDLVVKVIFIFISNSTDDNDKKGNTFIIVVIWSFCWMGISPDSRKIN